MNKSRRIFMLQTIAVGAVVTGALLPKLAYAQSTMLTETDRDAVALGYRVESSRVDKEKYPKHDSSQRCANCSWYQGRSGESSASCALYSHDKLVSANGWCSAWMKKS